MRFELLALGAALLAVVATPATAQSMNAEVYHKRATALMKKGPMALFSRGEIRALVEEGQAAGKASGAQREADLKAGRKPRYCAPAGNVSMKTDDYMKRLGAIPPADRQRIDMTEATNRIMAGKYPCPA